MTRYDRTNLSKSLLSFIESPTHQNREYLFSQILTFAYVKAKAHLRPFAAWWNEHAGDTFIAIEELADYGVMKFLNYLESERFDKTAWMENAMANLNHFFTCRALEWCRSEMNRLKRQTRADVLSTGWDHIESHHSSPESIVIIAEIEDAYAEAVDQLPQDLKVVIAKMKQGKKTGEIASQAGVPDSKVYDARRRIKTHLRRVLTEFTTV